MTKKRKRIMANNPRLVRATRILARKALKFSKHTMVWIGHLTFIVRSTVLEKVEAAIMRRIRKQPQLVGLI